MNTANLISSLFIQFISLALSGGIVEINLLSYKNELSKDSLGHCCYGDGTIPSILCDKQCSVFFRICLKEFQTFIDDDKPSCTFGNLTTRLISPGYSTTKLSQPLQFPFSFSWRGDFSLIVEVYHSTNENSPEYDKSKQLLLRVAESKKLATGSNWTTEWYRNEYSQLQLQYRIVCESGYYGQECSRHCSPRDDQFAHFVCSENGNKICIPGWTGSNCDKAICLSGCHGQYGSCTMPDECKCRIGYEGRLCDRCMKYPGCIHGTCEKAFECICDEGWGGIFCNQDLNYCTNIKPCKNNATCTNTGPGLYTCLCKEGFAGTNCELPMETCQSDSCYNNGSCIDGPTNFTCRCPKGFTGRRCGSNANSCFENPCENGATCFDFAQGYLCACRAGWEGHNCDVKIDACRSNPCKNDGKCISEEKNGFLCECTPGYSGYLCEINIDDCFSHPCLNGGTCIDKLNNFQCVCPSGYTDSLCQTETNACVKRPCKNGATCYSSSMSYKCICPAGFTDTDCSIAMGDCTFDSCKYGGTCVSSGSGPKCLCPPCYSGLDCSTSTANCNISSNWINTVNPADQNLSLNTSLILILCLTILFLVIIVTLSIVIIMVRRRLYTWKDDRWRDSEAKRENESNDETSKQMYDYKDNRMVVKVENNIHKFDKIKNPFRPVKNPNLLDSSFVEDSKLNTKSNLANSVNKSANDKQHGFHSVESQKPSHIICANKLNNECCAHFKSFDDSIRMDSAFHTKISKQDLG